jgi:hypothetical protein
MTTYRTPLPRPEAPLGRLAAGLRLFVILDLTAATALIHLGLGGSLFALNGIGFLGLGAAVLAASVLPVPVVRRFAWLPRIGLAGYALVTIGAYLVMGPYITLGWIAKAIEVAIIGLVAVDLLVDLRGG